MAKTDTTKKDNKEKCRILTPEFRVAYPHVFKPSGMRGTSEDNWKYSITMLFPKNADLTLVKNAIREAKIAKFGDKANWPDALESPVADGDSPKFADREGYKGHWAIKASSKRDQKPGVVDEDAQLIVDPAKFYPGCYAHAYVFAYVWEFAGKQGVGFILDHVQKTREGKSLSGKKSVEDVFAPITTSGAEEVADEETF